MIWKILAGIVALWLIGSAIYSSRFHYANYSIQRHKIKSGLVDEIYERLHNQQNWGMLVVIQLVKFAIGFYLFYLIFL